MYVFFFFKQKTAYEVRISDWSSDVCSSDLLGDDNLNRREDAKNCDPWKVGERRDVDDSGLLERRDTLASKHDRQHGDQRRTVGEKLRNRQLAAIAQHRPADRKRVV